MSEIITVDNIESVMVELLQNNNYIDTYKKLKHKVFNEDILSDSYLKIEDNYYAIFTYYSIIKNIPLNEFAYIIKDIYESNKVFELSMFFDRFFNYSGTDMTFKDYVNGNITSVFDKIYYTFLDYKYNNVIFNKEKLPYLLLMLEMIPEEKIKSLHEGRFTIYCGYNFLKNNLNELKPIFKLKNPALKLSKEGEYNSVNSGILSFVGREVYERDDKDNQLAFETLSKVLPNFEKIFLDKAIELREKNGTYSINIDNSLVAFSRFGNIDIVENLLFKYQIMLQKNKENKTKNNLSELSSSIFVYFEKIDTKNIDFNKIDINKELIDNFVYLVFLDLTINKNEILDLNEDVSNYLLKNIKNSEKSYQDEYLYLYSRKEDISNYLLMCKLNENLNKKNNNRKVKL